MPPNHARRLLRPPGQGRASWPRHGRRVHAGGQRRPDRGPARLRAFPKPSRVTRSRRETRPACSGVAVIVPSPRGHGASAHGASAASPVTRPAAFRSAWRHGSACQWTGRSCYAGSVYGTAPDRRPGHCISPAPGNGLAVPPVGEPDPVSGQAQPDLPPAFPLPALLFPDPLQLPAGVTGYAAVQPPGAVLFPGLLPVAFMRARPGVTRPVQPGVLGAGCRAPG